MTEKFELGRLVATPGAIEATTLRQHFNLVARHARFEARLATLRETRSARQPDTKPGLRSPFLLTQVVHYLAKGGQGRRPWSATGARS